MNRTDDAIFKKFRIKRHDNLPLTGWAGTRRLLAELLGELGFNRGVEVGVREGIYSEILCLSNPNIELSCVDPWRAFRRHSQIKMDRIFAQATSRLSKYNATLIKKTSMEAVKDFQDASLDFVYIDGLHDFDSVMMDIIQWSKKVKPGGIVAGHDFCHAYQQGVVYAVEAYARAHSINPWYLARFDREPSWLWVR